MPDEVRVLLVDDDPSIRSVWSTILKNEGFHVTVAATVAEALSLIMSQQFHVLVADLNIGEPADGFTIVSAMRRVQPQVVNLILTGYPAFQAALRAIHEQVDDFLVKPADPEKLLAAIRQKLVTRGKRAPILSERLATIIARNKESIIQSWYEAVEKDREIRQVPLSREERVDHMPEVLDEITRKEPVDRVVAPGAHSSATKHGQKRREQGYTPALLMEETRILQRVLGDCTQQNLLMVDISNLIPDLLEMQSRVHRMLRYSLEALLDEGARAAEVFSWNASERERTQPTRASSRDASSARPS